MRAPIEPGNPGWDPDAARDRGAKVGAALRGAGFLIIVIAFLFVSQQFVGGDDDPETGPAAIYIDTALKRGVEAVAPTGVVEYGASAALRAKVENGSAVDVFIGQRADTQALLDAGRCSEPVAVVTTPAEYAGCLVDRDGARADAGAKFLDQLTGIAGRDALLKAGYELPAR